MSARNRLLVVVVAISVFVLVLAAIFSVLSGLSLFTDSIEPDETRIEADTPRYDPGVATTGTPSNSSNSGPVTVAFIADSGMTNDSRAVLRLIKREGADVVVHSGDFDYQNDPAAWSEMLNQELGPDFPIIATMGNHDIYNWSEYQQQYRERTERVDDLQCTGDLGLHSTCTFRGIAVVQTVDELCSLPSGDDEAFPAACGDYESYEPAQYIEQQLRAAETDWRICSWHLPNHYFQVGEKHGVPRSIYDSCREAGGDLIATGDNHAYARTYPMANFTQTEIASRSTPYTLGNGSAIALVTGASGRSFYEPTEMATAEWWAKTHTSGEFGAFFCTLRSDRTGTCYFKTIAGDVIDGPFEIRTRNATNHSTVNGSV
jgi:hypothetical protein